MIGKKYFSGPEVEGRLYNINTLFLREPAFPVTWQSQKFPHIYICREVLEHEHFHWNQIRTVLQVGKIVTLELNPEQLKIVPEDIFCEAHIQLVLDIPEFAKLKQNDSLKVVTAPFTTFNTIKCMMQTSTPDDYKNDKEVTI